MKNTCCAAVPPSCRPVRMASPPSRPAPFNSMSSARQSRSLSFILGMPFPAPSVPPRHFALVHDFRGRAHCLDRRHPSGWSSPSRCREHLRRQEHGPPVFYAESCRLPWQERAFPNQARPCWRKRAVVVRPDLSCGSPCTSVTNDYRGALPPRRRAVEEPDHCRRRRVDAGPPGAQ